MDPKTVTVTVAAMCILFLMDSSSCQLGNAYTMLGEESRTNSNFMLFKLKGLDVLEMHNDHMWQSV